MTVTNSSKASPVEAQLRARAADAILVLDGAMGTEIQDLKLGETGYRGERFADWPSDLRGNNDILILSQPDAIAAAPSQLLPTPAPTSSRPTPSPRPGSRRPITARRSSSPSSTSPAPASPRRLPRSPRARTAARASSPARSGPTNRTASISPDVSNPGFRAVTFDELREAYGEQAKGLVEGGADLLLLETIFDTLNAKAALYAIAELFEARGNSAADHDIRHRSPISPDACSRARRRRHSGSRSSMPRRSRSGSTARWARRRCAPTSRTLPASPTRSSAPIPMRDCRTSSASTTRARNTWRGCSPSSPMPASSTSSAAAAARRRPTSVRSPKPCAASRRAGHLRDRGRCAFRGSSRSCSRRTFRSSMSASAPTSPARPASAS